MTAVYSAVFTASSYHATIAKRPHNTNETSLNNTIANSTAVQARQTCHLTTGRDITILQYYIFDSTAIDVAKESLFVVSVIDIKTNDGMMVTIKKASKTTILGITNGRPTLTRFCIEQ